MAAKPRFRKDADPAAPGTTDESVAENAAEGRKHPVDETLPH